MTISARTAPAAHRRARPAAVAAVACALAAVSACSSGGVTSPAPKPAASTQPPTKPADPAETAKQQAISTYRSYWKAMERVYATAKLDGTDITKYAASAALSRPRNDIQNMQRDGSSFSGNVTVNNPTVTRADLDRKTPNVAISSCLDVSGWKVLDKDKKPVALPSKRLTKYVSLAVVERWPEGWRVIRDEPQAGQPC
ncbi:hypothetical protein [Streptomyces sp. NPDC045470]|uniref:hypothetical protein n=1 Tax=Streptomyces sp. NPDC045470 TaxID=3155469 RepID=UPI0033E2BC76